MELFIDIERVGGTAGSVLASRLSEDPNTSVLLLERGTAKDTWKARIPLLSSNTFDPSTGIVGWDSQPNNFCNQRINQVLRGEVLGGTSRVNGLMYNRGAAADYDYWASLGYPEWSYEKVLPYFKKSEKTLTHTNSSYRGTSGGCTLVRGKIETNHFPGPWINQNIPYLSWSWKAYHVSVIYSSAFLLRSILTNSAQIFKMRRGYGVSPHGGRELRRISLRWNSHCGHNHRSKWEASFNL